jgi:hypothetical protein
MRLTRFSGPVLLLALAACSQPAQQQTAKGTSQPAPPAPITPALPVANDAENVALPDDRTPLEEPKGPIDPKSAEAAGQVVQHYGALIEQGRWTESWKLWSNPDTAKVFDRNWHNDSEVHMEIGKPGDMGGAAGSSYVTVPTVFYSDTFRRAADVILRRVNDVPGSTEAQRRWHIERIELKG